MFNIPNLLTASNMLCGILSILLSLSGRIDLAPYPIFLGAIFDFLDGFMARILKQQGELGKQLDSLADMITFGLAPGIMMFVILLKISVDKNLSLECTECEYLSFSTWIDVVLRKFHFEVLFALLIPVFSMFRLAKFNLDTRQSESFIGVPTPANTIFFCMFPLILVQDFAVGSFQFQVREFIMQVWVLIPIIVIMSILLISEIPLFSLKFKHFKWKGNEIRFIFLITCSLLIPLTRFWSMGIIVLLYLILSIIENILKTKKHEIQS
ncbi:MAG: CDP-alcohol phosphatidyltransferase family protein [Flavobacteriia bacterium]